MLFHNYKYTCMNFLQIVESLTKATTATITHIPAVSMKLKDLKSRQSYKSSSEVSFFMILFWLCIYFCKTNYVSFHSNCYDDSTIFILGIQRIFGIATAIRRQGFIGSLSGIAPVAVAGAATAGVFRNEIAAIVEDLVSEFVTT